MKITGEGLRQGWECRLVVDVQGRTGVVAIRTPAPTPTAAAATRRPLTTTTTTPTALRTLKARIYLKEDLLLLLGLGLRGVGFSL